jgi:hypothetical protein
MAAGLAVVAVALALSAAHDRPPGRTPTVKGEPAAVARERPADHLVRAPVRIADPAAVALLRPGVRVDVFASGRVLAAGAGVIAVPSAPDRAGSAPAASESGSLGGALIVLAVPRRTAAALSGAAATSPLGVALC